MASYFENSLLFTTDGGLEHIVKNEFIQMMDQMGFDKGEIETKPFGLWGHVVVKFSFSEEYLWPVIKKMHSIHHVLRLKYEFTISKATPLQDIIEQLYTLEIAEFDNKPSFRVTTTRSGRHNFQSPDVERESGAVIVEKYGSPVDLENYDVHLRVNVFKETCIVGIQLTNTLLSRRNYKPFQPRISLKSNVAYALLQISEIENKSQGRLLDPFCGSGTILLEALSINPSLEVYGADIHKEKIDGALRNLQELEGNSKISISQNNARFIGEDYPHNFFDAIVCNPPYGFLMGKKFDFYGLYRFFLQGAIKALKPEGTVVMLVMKKKLLEEVIDQVNGLEKIESFRIETGGIYPWIYKMKKKLL